MIGKMATYHGLLAVPQIAEASSSAEWKSRWPKRSNIEVLRFPLQMQQSQKQRQQSLGQCHRYRVLLACGSYSVIDTPCVVGLMPVSVVLVKRCAYVWC